MSFNQRSHQPFFLVHLSHGRLNLFSKYEFGLLLLRLQSSHTGIVKYNYFVCCNFVIFGTFLLCIFFLICSSSWLFLVNFLLFSVVLHFPILSILAPSPEIYDVTEQAKLATFQRTLIVLNKKRYLPGL